MCCLDPRSFAGVGIARASASARRWDVPYRLDVASVLEFGSDVQGTIAVDFVFDRIWLGGVSDPGGTRLLGRQCFFASNVVRANVVIHGPKSAR